jgi:hypothetical protein
MVDQVAKIAGPRNCARVTVGAVPIAYGFGMKRWLQWNPDRTSAIRQIGIMVVIVGGFVAVMVYHPNLQRRGNAGFGAGWDCVTQARGEPVCIKKTVR